jgi:hypothetical protein
MQTKTFLTHAAALWGLSTDDLQFKARWTPSIATA